MPLLYALVARRTAVLAEYRRVMPPLEDRRERSLSPPPGVGFSVLTPPLLPQRYRGQCQHRGARHLGEAAHHGQARACAMHLSVRNT